MKWVVVEKPHQLFFATFVLFCGRKEAQNAPKKTIENGLKKKNPSSLFVLLCG
jgi:hypothetical protein